MFYNPTVYARDTVDGGLRAATTFLETLADAGPDAPLPSAT